MAEAIVFGWLLAMFIGAVAAYFASQKATENGTAWGIGIFASTVLFGLLGLLLTGLLFLAVAETDGGGKGGAPVEDEFEY